MGDAQRELYEWIIESGSLYPDVGEFIGALGEKMIEVGLPVYRVSSGIPILHPLIRAESALWIEGEGVSWRQYPLALAEDTMFTNSPLYPVFEKGETTRVRITPEPQDGEFGIVADLRAEGATDYIAFPLRFSDQTNKSLTVATRRPGGLSEQDIAILEYILRPIALVFEIHTQRRSAETLLGTYVGHRTAPRVLAGEIKRGDGQQIEAVIWFSDLRGFTELSSQLTPRELVDVLDFYFESMTDPVGENGGEVLKFIGDAVLAIFTFSNESEAREASEKALIAAHAAHANLEGFRSLKHAETVGNLSVGISLHMGAVFYGNVGGRERLDFTVVGEAVNIGSRINGLCRDIGHPILASEDFVEYVDHPFTEVGTYSLKGVRRPQRVYFPTGPQLIMPDSAFQSEMSRP